MIHKLTKYILGGRVSEGENRQKRVERVRWGKGGIRR